MGNEMVNHFSVRNTNHIYRSYPGRPINEFISTYDKIRAVPQPGFNLSNILFQIRRDRRIVGFPASAVHCLCGLAGFFGCLIHKQHLLHLLFARYPFFMQLMECVRNAGLSCARAKLTQKKAAPRTESPV